MKLTAQGYGPITDTTVIDIPPGGCVIEGPSRVGKTTVMNLVALALWGKQADGSDINQKFIQDRAAIRLDLDAMVVRVAVSPGPRWTRKITTPDINDLSLPSQQELARHLDDANPEGKPGSRWDVGLTVMSPTRWVSLYQDGQRGRSLRDLLSKVLPSGDLPATVASLMSKAGDELAETDPLHLQDVKPTGAKEAVKGAASIRTAANSEADKAQAARDEANRSLADAQATVKRIESETPTEDAVTKAREVLAARDAWVLHDDAMRQYEREHAVYTTAIARCARYDVDLAAIGTEPVLDIAGEAAAKSAVSEASTAVDLAAAAVATAQADLAAARATEAAERRAEQERIAAAERAEQEKQSALAEMKAQVERMNRENEARAAREAVKPKVQSSETVPLFQPAPTVTAGPVTPAAPVAVKYDARSFNAGVDACIDWVSDYRENEECPDIRTVRDRLHTVKIQENE